ncbi:MAG: hypothetical protein QOF09_5289 [Alphaproteobacteria bacterium]|jgi:hypothetical protein|nr:hypothetical protein [Alphaproteobacteria bacterium]
MSAIRHNRCGIEPLRTKHDIWGLLMSSRRAIIGTLLVLAVASSANAAEKPKSSETIWYERIEAGCKADAKKYYSAIRFNKRRGFVKRCIDRAYR